MNVSSYISSLVILLCFNLTSGQQSKLKLSEDFKEISIVETKKRFWFSDYSSYQYMLYKECGEIFADEVPRIRDKRSWLVDSPDHGILIGVNGGEWLGGLGKMSLEGTYIHLKETNVKFLHLDSNNDVILFEVDRECTKSILGSIYWDEKTSKLEVNPLATLNDIPMYMYYNDVGDLYISGLKNLYVYKKNSITPFFEKGVWDNIGTGVRSMKQENSNNDLLIGIQGGILRVNTETKEVKLFVLKI